MRNFLHVLFSAILWCLFGYYWYIVIARQITFDSFEALGLLGLITLIGVILTIWWVAHNKRMASQNRRKGAPPPPAEDFSEDHLGRPILSPGIDRLRTAQTVRCHLDRDGNKIYRTEKNGEA